MRISGREACLGLIGLAALPALSACAGAARIDCDQVAERARLDSQARPIRIESVANLRETARTDTELRCIGDVTLADGGTTPLYFRARQANGQIEIAYQGVPYP